jgi:hypothetical protein
MSTFFGDAQMGFGINSLSWIDWVELTEVEGKFSRSLNKLLF